MNSNLNIHNNYTTKQLRLPLDLEIKIPFDSEVRTFDEVFKRLKLERYLISQKDNRGRVGYNPVKMLKLVLFCQMEKIQSLRAMEKAAKNDIRIMWLTDEMKPSHQAIKNFLDSYLVKNIEDIFYEITNFLITKEKIDTEKLYIDGTKIESMANKYTFVWRGSVEKFQIKLYKKISKYLESLNQRYELENIYFPIYTEYNVDYLSKVHQFINDQVKRSNITFTYGKGNRKTALQRDFEKIDEYLSKLIEYENH
ncbi:MAG: transposase [Acholeplasmataceae bacterium]|jgi:transposase